MGLRDRIRNRPKVPKAPGVKDLIGQGLEIVDQAVTDQDALNKLKYTLGQAQAQLMLGGQGFPITKYTICFLCSMVVSSGTWTFLFHPENMASFNIYALAVVPVIGILTGSYVTGTSFKRSKWSNGK